jgi:hypothetical protein
LAAKLGVGARSAFRVFGTFEVRDDDLKINGDE